jgi:hypothetical protein
LNAYSSSDAEILSIPLKKSAVEEDPYSIFSSTESLWSSLTNTFSFNGIVFNDSQPLALQPLQEDLSLIGSSLE